MKEITSEITILPSDTIFAMAYGYVKPLASGIGSHYYGERDRPPQWNNIHGNREEKQLPRNTMARGFRRKYKVDNVLLFGPPGTRKMMMLKSAGRWQGGPCYG